MAATEQQQNKMNQWLVSKGLRLTCPVCGGMDWNIGAIFTAPENAAEGFVMTGDTLPMVQVVCNNCAYMMLFASHKIGLT